MILSQLQQTFVLNVAELIRYIDGCGFACTFGEAWRPEWVAKKYAEERKGIEKSLHIIRLAIDLNLFKEGKYLSNSGAHKPFGDYWEGLHPNNNWGGRYGDGNHYEMLLEKRKQGE